MAEKLPSLELRPPPAPDSLLPPPEPLVPVWAMVCLGVMVLLLVVGFVGLIRRAAKPKDSVSLRRRAYREALRAFEKSPAGDGREAATVSSLILRRYLAVVVQEPALYETHEEFIGRHDGLKILPEQARAATIAEFDRFAAMKYGKDTHDAEAAPVIASARQLLETLNHALAA